MNYFFIEPEVAGGLGKETVADRSVHPPIIHSLHYEFNGWLGDVLLESFPAFVMTAVASQALLGLTGFDVGPVKITKSQQFDDIYPDRTLPRLVWFRPLGVPAVDDFGCVGDGRLVVSKRALEALRSQGLVHAVVESFRVS